MVDEGYNTHAILRSGLGMGATVPTDAQLTTWINLVDGKIEAHNPNPNVANAATIEYNRIGAMYNQTRKKTGTDKEKYDTAIIPPLSDGEKNEIDVDETQVDSVLMNGQQSYYGGRR